MKKWTVKLFRSNPQLASGGYETTRTVEARTERSAWKKAEEICNKMVYGSMTVVSVEQEVQ